MSKSSPPRLSHGLYALQDKRRHKSTCAARCQKIHREVSARRARKLRARGAYIKFSHLTSTGKARYTWIVYERDFDFAAWTDQLRYPPASYHYIPPKETANA